MDPAGRVILPNNRVNFHRSIVFPSEIHADFHLKLSSMTNSITLVGVRLGLRRIDGSIDRAPIPNPLASIFLPIKELAGYPGNCAGAVDRARLRAVFDRWRMRAVGGARRTLSADSFTGPDSSGGASLDIPRGQCDFYNVFLSIDDSAGGTRYGPRLSPQRIMLRFLRRSLRPLQCLLFSHARSSELI